MIPLSIPVNTTCASIVDSELMIDALKTQSVAGAAQDVFDQEPLPSSPITALPNVVLSPHNESMTPKAIACGNEMVVDNIIAFLQGGPINFANEWNKA